MERHTSQSFVCCLMLFTIIKQTTSFDLGPGGLDNKDVPEAVKKYLATFETRIIQAVDSEFKRQLTMIQARIDYRIPSLLDLTLTDRINSRFINKAMNDALVNRVETLEGEVDLLRDYLVANMTELDELKSRLQESENKLQIMNSRISSESSSNTAVVRRLESEIQKTDSKVNVLFSNTATIRPNTEGVHFNQKNDLDGIKFELRTLNSSIAFIDSTIANIGQLVSNNTAALKALDMDVHVLTENTTLTSSGVSEMETKLLNFGSRVTKMVASSTRHSHAIDALILETLSLKENVTLLSSSVADNILDMTAIKSDIRGYITKGTRTDLHVDELEQKISAIGVELNGTVSVATANTRDIKAVNAELPSIRSTVVKSDAAARANTNRITSLQTGLMSLTVNINTLTSQIESHRKDVKFEVRLSAKMMAVTKGSIMKFDQVQYNTDNSYNTNTGVFSAPVSGSYFFWANIVVHGRSSSIELAMMKNGVNMASGAAITSTRTQFDTISLTVVAELNVGDRVWFKKTQGSSDSIYGLMFSGYGGILIRAK